MEERIEAHPIQMLIGHLLEEGNAGEEPVVIRAEARSIAEQAIDEYAKAGSPELMNVAQTIFSIADILEDKKSPQTAAILCEMLDRPHVLGAMQMINERLKNHLGTLEMGTPGDDFASFAEKDTTRRAPSVEESAPDDAVKLGTLSFPKRL